MDMLSSISPKVIMIHDLQSWYMFKIGEVSDCKIRESYEKLCDEWVLKEEFKNFEMKGLTYALEFRRNFKTKEIMVVLRRIHDMKFWLHNGLAEITKMMIHKVTSCLTLDKKNTMRSPSHEEVEENIDP